MDYLCKQKMDGNINSSVQYWFQHRGYFDSEKQVWVPYHPLPEFFELPGPINIFLRPDSESFIKSGELKQIRQRWSRERWPRISKSMRQFYVEKRRPSLRRFRTQLWQNLRSIKEFTSADLQKKFKINNGDEFRLDHYGNVLAFRAEKSSRTSWDVDHLFPWSKGGLSEPGNLRIILARANRVVKRDRFEALIKPERMQIGVSLQQLLDLEKKYRKEPQLLYDYLTKSDKKIESEIQDHTLRYHNDLQQEELLCDYCFQKEASSRCENCKQYQYCSLQCHSNHWNQYRSSHRTFCKNTLKNCNSNSKIQSFFHTTIKNNQIECFGQQIVSRNEWCADVSILQELTNDRQAIQVNVSSLEFILSEEIWEDENENPITPLMVIENRNQYKSHSKRIDEADLKFPILVLWPLDSKTPTDVLDGAHRLSKAKLLNIKTIDVRVVTQEDIEKAKIDCDDENGDDEKQQ